jgi:uncharacterized membrane protein
MDQASGSRRRYNELAGTNVGRLAGISDGIFSVGMTLLVLGLTVPALSSTATESELLRGLAKLGPNALIYAMSFMTLGIFWSGQARRLDQLERSNRHYAWLQLTFLFAVTLVPFSTALLAHFPSLKVALVEYWLNIVLLGAMLLASLEYGLHAQLFKEDRRSVLATLGRGRILIAQALYATAVLLTLIFPTWVSIALIVIIQLNYVVAPRIPLLERF